MSPTRRYQLGTILNSAPDVLDHLKEAGCGRILMLFGEHQTLDDNPLIMKVSKTVYLHEREH